MSNDRKAAIREELVTAQKALIEVLDSVGPDEWLHASPTNEGWTVRDLLTHLTTSEVSFVPALRRMAAGEGGVPADFDPNRWNAGQLRRRGDTQPQQLRHDLEAAHDQMLELLESVDAQALDQRGHMSTGGDGSTEDNFRLVAEHKRSHTEDIRAALAARGRVPPTP